MKSLSLNGEWNLYYYDSSKVNIFSPCELNVSNIQKIPATVPGNVELDLIQSKELPEDIFYSTNVDSLRKYELYEWWYEREFYVEKDYKDYDLSLKFDGVDTVASYYINGKKIGESKNMLHEHELLITDGVRVGKNTLTVKIESPIIYASKQKQYSFLTSHNADNYAAVFVRKAPHMYGWDIMCRALSAGIWKDVTLEYKQKIRIESYYLATKIADKNEAHFWFSYNLNIPYSLYNAAYIELSGKCGDKTIYTKNKVKFCSDTIHFFEKNGIELWYPTGYGKQPLYDVSLKLTDEYGNILDVKRFRFGIRYVEFIHQADTEDLDNSEFLFKVNGENIFCKGSNWVPCDAFHSRDKDRTIKSLQLLKDSNSNIVRMWGGNVYENDEFFDFCDENGIMVWQDFALACSFYPLDETFKNLLDTEIEKVCKRLRNHASLIIYSGDNEIDANYNCHRLNPRNNLINREYIPRALFLWDPYRHYLPSSPLVPQDFFKKALCDYLPESHLWYRKYFKCDFFVDYKASFLSEIGYLSSPSVESIKKFIRPENLWSCKNDDWFAHCTAPDGKDGVWAQRVQDMLNQIEEMFGINPDNLEDFYLASQIAQAEAMKFFIEHARNQKWNKTGIIWWNLIDGWPQFSDSIVDYYYEKKLAYPYVKLAQRSLNIACLYQKTDSQKVVLQNDTLQAQHGGYTAYGEDGKTVLAKGKFLCEPNSNYCGDTLNISGTSQKLILLQAEFDGIGVVRNFAVNGIPPFDLVKYKQWLTIISHWMKEQIDIKI